MSVTNIQPCKDLKAIVKYCTTPKKFQKGERVACLYSDFGDSDLFLKCADKVLKNHRRKIQGYTLIQSFPKQEFNVHNQEHIEYVNELGRKLAYSLYKNSPCLIITHADSDSECLHNHIIVLNHDLQTDKCIRSNRLHTHVKQANDTLMQKYHLEVCKPSNQRLTQGEYWSNKRNNWLDQLKTSVDNALSHATSIAEFHNNLLAEGVSPALYKANGELKERFAYTFTDSDGKTHKKRSDRLGEGYSRQAIEETLRSNKNRRQQQSIMSMSDWIELQKANERNDEPLQQAEATPPPHIDVIEIKPKISKKKTESPTIPEREKDMEQEIILKELLNDKAYQELLDKKRSIQHQLEKLEQKFEDDTYENDDLRKVPLLRNELYQVESSIKNFGKPKPISKSDVKLNERLLPHDTPSLSKDRGMSL